MKLVVSALAVVLLVGIVIAVNHDGLDGPDTAVASYKLVDPTNMVYAAETNPDTAAAMKALDEYMAAFNSRDEKAWAATLNYPHVRLAGGEVKVWKTPEEYCADFDFDAFAKKYNWDHSQWDKREVVQQGPGKVHVCVTFSRFDAKGNKLETYDSLYIVTNDHGHWGTLARSSYAP